MHSLVGRAVAGGLLAAGVSPKVLRELLDDERGDRYFDRVFANYHRDRLRTVKSYAGAERLSSYWKHVGVFEDVSQPVGNRLQVEDALSERSGKGRLSYPFTSDIHVLVRDQQGGRLPFLAGQDRRYVSVQVDHRVGGHKGLPVLALLRRVANWQPHDRFGTTCAAMMRWLFGDRRLEIRSGEADAAGATSPTNGSTISASASLSLPGCRRSQS